MSEYEYLTFCPHCDCNLPARTFRNHRERFFNPTSNIWEKVISLNLVDGDDDDDEDELFMEIRTDITPFNQGDDDLRNSLGADSSLNVEDLLDNEIWDEVGVCDIEDDFPQNESFPNVNVHVSSTCNLNVLLARCMVILLAYFWT